MSLRVKGWSVVLSLRVKGWSVVTCPGLGVPLSGGCGC